MQSDVVRRLFLSQDRADITYAVSENVRSFTTQLHKIEAAHSALGERQGIQVFELGNMSSEVTVSSDSDWAETK